MENQHHSDQTEQGDVASEAPELFTYEQLRKIEEMIQDAIDKALNNDK